MAELTPPTTDEMERLAEWYAAQADAGDRLAGSLDAEGLVAAASTNRRRAARYRRTVQVIKIAIAGLHHADAQSSSYREATE